MLKIDLNCDLGESFGAYKIGMDKEVLPYMSSANIACGFHASDPLVMMKTVCMAGENKVGIGAHPGYPDLVGFGRREMKIDPKEVYAMVVYQIGALDAFCRANGYEMQHVKPHGAMYNMAGKDKKLADAICQAVYDVNPNLIVLGLAGSKMEDAAKEKGLRFAKEVFADRAYEEDGSLVARTKPGAMITDEEEAIERVIGMIKDHEVMTITGKKIPIQADSVCIHGDGPKALVFAGKIRARLLEEGICITRLSDML